MKFAVEKTTTRGKPRFQWIEIPDSAVNSVKAIDDDWLEVKSTMGTFHAKTWKM